ncbi:ATP-binding cassette domain-containing protein [Oscillibacter sp.]|uniref:ATP-binding cassette domain-containing protein n=1 Tax=Oscillibacter sp. TaxID=1945593 RepID=UPI002616A257|nr:ATP-binding cassette domain-containing protein [Oscillibacter sp.]MDD3347205.1 ATP-binding cassette domain-containing protein [Oscillibacter sp.]
METYAIQNLTFYYPEQAAPALCEVNVRVERGQFVTLCGPSGCGKSTLLRQLKSVLTPKGPRKGQILFEGVPLEGVDLRTQSRCIGFVQQDPDNQIVTDKVWHELAFGLESLGYDTPFIRKRVAEMASFFGIQTWFHKNVSELSGGQKQLLNLASIMAMQPQVLVLDEPTSQLDPIAAGEFLATVGRIHRELGTTVIMTEHRLEEAFPMSDRVLVMDRGAIIADGTPEEAGRALRQRGHAMFLAMPAAMRIWAAAERQEDTQVCPVTVRDGQRWLGRFAQGHSLTALEAEKAPPAEKEIAIELEDTWFRYGQEQPDVLKGVTMTVGRGEFLALLGGNGSGKTTLLSVIGGMEKAYRGDMKICGSVGMLPQNPKVLFLKKTVREDLGELLRGSGLPDAEERIARMVRLCRLEELLDRHPYDLSGGEQQRAALAKILLLSPQILLPDEPTKGLDAEFKQLFAQILRTLLREGVTVCMVSHDVEFCAEYAHRCALFFDGAIVSAGSPRAFFSGNSFYTTAASRIAGQLVPGAVTTGDVIKACGGFVESAPLPEDSSQPLPQPLPRAAGGKLPGWRRAVAAASGAAALLAFIKAIGVTDLSALLTSGGMTAQVGAYAKIYAVLAVSLLLFALSVGQRARQPVCPVRQPRPQRKLPRRTVAAAGMILLLIPITLFVGVWYLGDRKYYFISLLVLLETMLPFALTFEGRKPQPRELVVIAVLCALGVAGRTALFMVPEFKPVVALVILSGVAFGGETGFLVGAMTMLTSNMLFGQGAWTPWQMFTMGLIGFLAGVLFRKGVLCRTKGSLCIFGALAALLYGAIMNPVSALMWTHTLNGQILLTYYISGLPLDVVRAAATVIFLLMLGEPMLEKLDRIKVKYDLIE